MTFEPDRKKLQEWFTKLTIYQLRKLWIQLEDIWNYRSELSFIRKEEIVPNIKMFPISVQTFYNLTNQNKMRKIILNENFYFFLIYFRKFFSHFTIQCGYSN